jgi:hypothetical protein
MKRIIQFLPLAVVFIGIATIIYYVRDHKIKKTIARELVYPEASAPESENMTPTDQDLVQSVFDNPQEVDALPAHNASALAREMLVNRPALMPATLENTSEHGVYLDLAKMREEPPMAESFYSLRTDAVRNPYSEQNRAAVNSIMKSRQKRISQLDRSKIEL